MRPARYAVLLLTAACATQVFAQTAIRPTTTLAQETGNNTSAADGFAGQPNGNLPAGNISKVPIRSLLYPGAATKIYAHVLPWWGSSSHVSIGYNSQDPAVVRRQVEDMISRGIDGAVVDWYGTASYTDKGVKLYMQEAEAHPGFEFIVEIEHGGVRWYSCYPTCDATTAVIQLAKTVSQTFFASPAYVRANGRPVLMEFGMENLAQPVDWKRVQVEVPGNPLWIHRNPGGFSITNSGGSFGWLEPKTLDSLTATYDGSAYLDYFYKVASGFPALQTYGSVYKGFNDTIASWAPPGGRHIHQLCGQTWLRTFSILNQWYSPVKPLHALQLVTWNDYEEGSELETGIDNCVSVSGSVSGGTLTWSIKGQENTIDHYEVFVSTDGQNLMQLGEFPAGTRTLNLTSFNLPAGSYKVFVKAVGKPSIRNQMSAAISYAAGAGSGPAAPATSADLALSVSPGSLTLARGKSGQLSVLLTPAGGFSGNVALGCSNLPAGVSCSFSPGTVSSTGFPTTAVLTISAAGTTASLRPRGAGVLYALWLPGMGVAGIVIAGSNRRSRRTWIAGAIVLATLIVLTACGGAVSSTLSNPAHPATSQTIASAGTYTITVHGSAGSIKRFTTATLVLH